MTDDITDPRLAKALAHRLRIQILRLLDDRTASPSEIAEEVGAPLTNVAYHVRKLASLELIHLVRRAPRRGVVEHYYSAHKRAKVSDEAWAEMPRVVKRALVEASVDQAMAFVRAAAGGGGFDHDDAHFSRTNMRLDREGWKRISTILARALEEIEEVEAEAAERVKENPDGDYVSASAMMMLFEAPDPSLKRDGRPRTSRSRSKTEARTVS